MTRSVVTRTPLAVALALALSGCLQSTEPLPSQLALRGRWIYSGVQTGSARENLTGTLTVSTESGTAFQGRIDLVGVNQQTGATRLLGGLVSGSGSSSVIDFDASLESSPRRHVGQISADTITGTWVGNSPDGVITTGTFRAEREPR